MNPALATDPGCEPPVAAIPIAPLPDRLSRQLRTAARHRVIKRITGTYRYYLTKAGRATTAAAERLKQATIVPAMI